MRDKMLQVVKMYRMISGGSEVSLNGALRRSSCRIDIAVTLRIFGGMVSTEIRGTIGDMIMVGGVSDVEQS